MPTTNTLGGDDKKQLSLQERVSSFLVNRGNGVAPAPLDLSSRVNQFLQQKQVVNVPFIPEPVTTVSSTTRVEPLPIDNPEPKTEEQDKLRQITKPSKTEPCLLKERSD